MVVRCKEAMTESRACGAYNLKQLTLTRTAHLCSWASWLQSWVAYSEGSYEIYMEASECCACLTYDKCSINSSYYYQPLLTHSRFFSPPFALNNRESQNIQENFKANFPHLKTHELCLCLLWCFLIQRPCRISSYNSGARNKSSWLLCCWSSLPIFSSLLSLTKRSQEWFLFVYMYILLFIDTLCVGAGGPSCVPGSQNLKGKLHLLHGCIFKIILYTSKNIFR